MDKIFVKHTRLEVPNYELGSCELLERSLSMWNKVTHKMEAKGFMYNIETNTLYLPRALDVNFVARQLNRQVVMDYSPDEPKKANMRLMVEPRSDIQKKALSFLFGVGDFAYTKGRSQLSLNLGTGDGKTYVTIAALTYYKEVTMIITHINRLEDQWVGSLKKFTDIRDSEICEIDGSKDIKKLMESDKLNYKVYFVNHRTLHSYGNKHGWDAVGKLFKKLQIGVKVYDEAHLEFDNILRIDFSTNTKKTIYLTATFQRTGVENKVFNLCFKNIAKYGIETRNEKRKHIRYMGIIYNSKPSMEARSEMKNIHGFDKNKYCDYLAECKKFYEVLFDVMHRFDKLEGKQLILVSKIDAVEWVAKYIHDEFPEKTVGMYHSKIPMDEKMASLDKDIIVSTPKSMGTGVDVPGLRICIMTEPYSSEVTADQTSGRLREYAPDLYSFYVELVDKGFMKVYKMYKERNKVFKKKCDKVLEIPFDEK